MQTLGVRYASSFGGAIEGLWFSFTETISSLTWGPFLTFCKSQVLRALSGINAGHLTIIDGDDVYEFGPEEAPYAFLRVRSGEFWTRIALFTDLGLAESFMSSIVDCDDVSKLVKMRSKQQFKYGFRFPAFLSPDMNYSSAIFSKIDADLTGVPEDTLEDGQMRKMRMILRKADIRPGDRVLEIGTGWGSLAILAATTIPGCTIDTVTLSSTQATFVRNRIGEAGLSDSIVVHEMDFRECYLQQEWAGTFDRFISIEMIEHVGRDFLVEYWKVVDWAMKPDTGMGVVQLTTFPETRGEEYNSEGADFIQKWVNCFTLLVHLILTGSSVDTILVAKRLRPSVFPGAYLPTPCILMETMKTGSSGCLTVDSMVNIGPHYARTLREWKRNFLDAWEETISPALVRKYNLTAAEQEVFRRKWISLTAKQGFLPGAWGIIL
ncbi:Mycolic acid cyclopropane synthetase-domain-containing protein [Desarmillaria tabescens]|uniref:Mycolic acid cyclopropane synthetase-domain-containing protein n=1 Tax=Armillaria tabescens TaxID=1929756 RepID=A0AA39JQM1_ARMTA|nr:Mycolic acid cyclopropane synthetase-domain-containing protein [Desarmillaria tabescens]KAK0446954.1 Mycolic acid cyclopropane synthetase-domain-containing protein [Desarmillaria tabescens]